MVPHALSGLPRFHSSARVTVFGLVLAALAAAGSTACDKMPLTAPAGTVITLVSAANVLPLNGSTDIVAVLIESGASGTGAGAATTGGQPVHNGTVVTFTTSLGRIEPSEARTHNGRVTVKLISGGQSGTALVNAFSGGSKATELKVLIGAAAAKKVSLTAAPTVMGANGGTTTLSARVEDEAGNPLVGIPVTFTTSAGTLGATSAVTNEAGVATTTLSTTTAATVTASVGTVSSTAAITIRAQPTISLTVPAGSVPVGAAATFIVTPGSSSSLRDVTIDFGDGDHEDLGNITSSTTLQHEYDDDRIYLVTVRGVDADGAPATASGQVSVVPWGFTATAFPSSGPVSTNFSFSVSGVPTSVPIDHYEWDFGDGTPVRRTDSPSTTHQYAFPGGKTVKVTVVPKTGPTRSHTFEVVVTATPLHHQPLH
jgi:hypothetical protein